MLVRFDNALVMNVRTGKSKAGNDYAILKFLDADSGEDYKIWCFGDAVATAAYLPPMSRGALTFEIFAQDDGGARLVLKDFQPSN